jgi:transcriptional regulator with PAS, ATPase and Fis domain
VSAKSGKFELANGGTLLLDEVSEMEIRLQAKLLRVIQEGEVDRIGGRRPTPIDVRLIATSNRNLADCVKKGTFREDLFYRLNVVNLTLPPLRERVGDVSLLSKDFMKAFAEKNNKGVTSFAAAALSFLESHTWPGNVRELENVIERAVITCQGNEIGTQDIFIERGETHQSLSSNDGTRANTDWTPGKTLNDIERKVILEALQYHQGNRTHTAKALGISIRTLRNKIADYKKLGIQV